MRTASVPSSVPAAVHMRRRTPAMQHVRGCPRARRRVVWRNITARLFASRSPRSPRSPTADADVGRLSLTAQGAVTRPACTSLSCGVAASAEATNSRHMSWRQHHGHAHTPAPLDSEKPDLSYKPGMSGASAKERAKELRKYAEQRGMVKEAKRKEKELEVARQKQEMAASSASADTQKEKERPICSFFLQGKCNKGSKCKFQHVAPAAETTAAQDGPAADLDLVAKLPADMWLQIFSRLTVASVCSMARSCTALAACADNPEVWEEKRRQVFGSEPQEAGPGSEAEVGAVGAVGAAAQSSSSGSIQRAGGKPVGKSVGAGSTPRPLAKPSARLECCMSESSLQG